MKTCLGPESKIEGIKTTKNANERVRKDSCARPPTNGLVA